MWWVRTLAIIASLVLLGACAVFAWGWAPDIERRVLISDYTNSASRFLTAEPGLHIHVRDEGCLTCPAIMLVHGSNASLHTWEPWVSLLGDEWRLVSLDLPGHGLTGQHPTGDYSLDGAVEVVEFVRSELGLDRMHLAGNSRGGRVALHYAQAHPDRLDSLALIAASGVPPAEDAEPETESLAYRMAQSPTMGPVLTRFLPRSWVETGVRDSFVDQGAVTERMIDRYWHLLRHPGNRQATLTRYALPRDYSAYERATEVALPVLLMWGEADALVPVEHAHAFGRALPLSRVLIYPGVGHVPMEEIPEQSATDYVGFLNALDSLSTTQDVASVR